jgi:hypothetical protein
MYGARSPQRSLTPNPSPCAQGEGSALRGIAPEEALFTHHQY